MFNDTSGKAFMYVDPELCVLKKLLLVTNECFGNADWNLYVNACDPDDYIELHSDCTNSIEEGSDIIIMSMYESGASERVITFLNKTSDEKFEVNLGSDVVIKMNAKEQEQWRHAIGKEEGRRI